MDPAVSTRISPPGARPVHSGRLPRVVHAFGRGFRAAGITIGVVAIAVMLAATVVPRFVPFYKAYTVISGSMEPAIPTGSLIVLRPAAAENLRTGDIITFSAPGSRTSIVTHRIVGIGSTGGRPVFYTQGDANPTRDAWEIPAEGRGWRVTFHVPHLGTPMIWLSRPDAKRAILATLTVVVSVTAIALVWRREDPSDEPSPDTE